MKNRIRALRNSMNQSQTEFGDKVGMTRSMISNLELGVVEPADYIVALICAKFGVSEHWLRTGMGSMYDDTDRSIVNDLADQYGLDDVERAIIETYLSLPQEQRDGVKQFALNLSARLAAGEASPDITIFEDLRTLANASIDAYEESDTTDGAV